MVSPDTLPGGTSTLTMRFAVQKMGGPARVTLSAGGKDYGSVDLPTSHVGFRCIVRETRPERP